MLEKYWSTSHLRISIQLDNAEERIDTIEQPYALVGSSEGCDVCLHGIARRAILFVATSRGIRGVVLSDKSKNAGRSLRVAFDEPISLGPHKVTFQQPISETLPSQLAEVPESNLHPSATRATGKAAEEDSLYAVTWLTAGLRRYAQIEDERPVLVGRKTPCGIVLTDDRLSGQHCCVFRVKNRLWVIDLDSGNGTIVSKKEIRCASLDVGKSFVVGQQRVHFLSLHTNERMQSIEAESQARGETLRQKLWQAEQENRQSIDRLAVSDAALRRLAAQLEHAVARLQTFEVEIERKEQELAQSREELAAKRDEITAIEEQRNAISEELNALKDENVESRRALENAREAVEESGERSQSVADELETVKRQNAELRQAVEETRDQLADARDQLASHAIAEREEELRVLQEELATEREILHRLQLHVKAVDTDNTHINEDETCISSLAFQDILEDAMNGLPSIDDEMA